MHPPNPCVPDFHSHGFRVISGKKRRGWKEKGEGGWEKRKEKGGNGWSTIGTRHWNAPLCPLKSGEAEGGFYTLSDGSFYLPAAHDTKSTLEATI